MDRLRSMEVFVAAVDAGNFSAAADALNLSAVMVGKHIQQLEERLGAVLIQRTTRRHRVTDAGRAFYEECRKVLEQVRWAESAVERFLHAAPHGLLRVSAPVTLGGAEIATHVADFVACYPDVRVELVLNDGMVDLVEDGFDAAIRIGALDDDLNLVARPLRPYRMLVCASPEYLARHGTPQTPDDLVHHRCLQHLGWRQNGWRLLGVDGERAWPESAPLASNHGPALRLAALNGAGLVLQPEVLLAEDVGAGRLVRVLDPYLPKPRPVNLLYSRGRRPSPKLRAFIEHLLKRMGESLPVED